MLPLGASVQRMNQQAFYCTPLVKDISHRPDGKQRHKESSVAFLESSQLPRSDKSWIRVKVSWPLHWCFFQYTNVIAATCISQALFSKWLKCRERKEIRERSSEQALYHIKLEELSFKTKQSINANSCILVSGITVSKWVQFSEMRGLFVADLVTAFRRSWVEASQVMFTELGALPPSEIWLSSSDLLALSHNVMTFPPKFRG